MIDGEQRVAPALLREAVVARLERGVALGAYATRDAVRYLFLEEGVVRAVSVAVDPAEPIPAVSSIYPGLSWDEREMADEFGVIFDALPDPRPFRPVGGVLPEPIVATGSGVTQIVVGPVHAGIIEPGRFTFSSGGETIAHLDFQIGYAYRALERSFAHADPLAVVSRVARICGACSASRSLAYAMALESIAEARVAESAGLARQILAELERIYNHVFDLGVCASAAGWGFGHTAGLQLKERAQRICERAGGHRFLFDAIVPGGVGDGVLEDRADLRERVNRLASAVDDYVGTLFDNSSLVSRWTKTGILDDDAALALAVVGPAHRGSGGVVDVRDAAPYGAYRESPITVARAEGGDALARCRVKAAELQESFRIIGGAFDRLGESPLTRVPIVLPRDGDAVAAVEGPRGAETVALSLAGATIERVHFISASYRNWPAVAHATIGGIVPDAPLVNKSFNLCYACADR
jgi:Ni,Fe-hydrogenase III large subunit